MAGLIYSAALNALDRGKLDAAPDCARDRRRARPATALDPCVITAERGPPADGHGHGRRHHRRPTTSTSSTPDRAAPAAALPRRPAAPTRTAAVGSRSVDRGPSGDLAARRRPAATRRAAATTSSTATAGSNMQHAVGALVRGPRRPDASKPLCRPRSRSPRREWYEQVDPDQPTSRSRGQISSARATGPTPTGSWSPRATTRTTTRRPTGDFQRSTTGSCDVAGRRRPLSHASATVATLKAPLPGRRTDFAGAEPPPTAQVDNGRPFAAPHGFTVKVVATPRSPTRRATALTGEDRRAA